MVNLENFEMEMTPKKYLLIFLMGLLVFLPFLSHMVVSSTKTKTDGKCIFCDIANGHHSNTKLEVDNDEFVIFKDIHPASTYHYLAVPKQHMESIKNLTKHDIPLVSRMEQALKDLYATKGINTTDDGVFGFHVPPFTSIKHLHMHGILPFSNIGILRKILYTSGSYWFQNANEARAYLQNKEN